MSKFTVMEYSWNDYTGTFWYVGNEYDDINDAMKRFYLFELKEKRPFVTLYDDEMTPILSRQLTKRGERVFGEYEL